MQRMFLADLVDVVYSAGKVFDGLEASRQTTESFLCTGDTTGIDSSHDVALLHDLKQLAEVVIEHAPNPVDANFVIKLNASMTRSASLEPGALRRSVDHIGVNTAFGRHEPPAATLEQLRRLVSDSISSEDQVRNAAALFLAIAKAQPFKDGNKRSGIFAANSLLLSRGSETLLAVPFSEHDDSVALEFNLKLARAYKFDEDAAVIHALIEEESSR